MKVERIPVEARWDDIVVYPPLIAAALGTVWLIPLLLLSTIVVFIVTFVVCFLTQIFIGWPVDIFLKRAGAGRITYAIVGYAVSFFLFVTLFKMDGDTAVFFALYGLIQSYFTYVFANRTKKIKPMISDHFAEKAYDKPQ
ncbi:MAG: hypothetical protein DI585_06890 [Pseudomonas fluorescens]|nr:MAG: hypothetical protein DI585_06890 [Pseudomonas fluorescens]